MKKLFALILTLMLTLACACAKQENAEKAVTLTFSANATTGYFWKGFMLSGDCVTLDSEEGIYVSDPNPDMKDGVGGKTFFTLTPVKPGRSVIAFTYSRGWEAGDADQQVFLAQVDEGMNLSVTDITEEGVFAGTVVFVSEGEHFVLLETENEIIAASFDEGTDMPVQDENVILYTDGVMTLSLPAVVNVLAWGSVPSGLAR